MGSADVTWRPILPDALCSRALSAIGDIAEALRHPGAEWSPRNLTEDQKRVMAASLAHGDAGIALFFAYLAQSGVVAGMDQAGLRCLDSAIDSLASETMLASLYEGFSGIAWTVAHLDGRTAARDDEDRNAEIDAAVNELLMRPYWEGHYDLAAGLVGLGVYALERLPRPSAVKMVELVVDHLEQLAERRRGKTAWFTRPRLLSPARLRKVPTGYYDLGMAHGIPGAIAFLGEVCTAGVASEKAKALVDGAVAWLLDQRLSGFFSLFPPIVVPGVGVVEPARLAWCYGDAGIAGALMSAARCVGESAWEEEALVIAREACDRMPATCGIVDASLCHGATGLAHLFNRMFQASGDERLLKASLYWFERALDFQQPGEGVAGFRSSPAFVVRPDYFIDPWPNNPGLLYGAAGIGLALLAAATTVEPRWDRVLLASVPLITGTRQA